MGFNSGFKGLIEENKICFSRMGCCGRFGLRKNKEEERGIKRASWFVSLLLTTLNAIVAQY